MAYGKFLITCLLVTSLTACTGLNNRFDNDTTADEGLLDDSVLTDDPLGDVGDPSSVAYFNAAIGDRVLFEVDESALTAVARDILTGQAQFLISNPEYDVIIEGHADEQGTRDYNLALGARRASAVQQYLISQGVGVDRLRTVTFGKERPIAICSDESCYSQNRRAVTVLSASAGL